MSTTTFDSQLLDYIKEEAAAVLEKKKGKFKYNKKDALSKAREGKEGKSKVSQMMLEKYIAEEAKKTLKRDGIELQEKISLGKTGRITYHGVKGNFRGGQFMSRNIYMEIRKQQGIAQRIGSGIKEIYLKGLQKSRLYKLRPAIKKAAEAIANFFRTRGASMLSRFGPGSPGAGAVARAFVMKIGGYLGTALGAVPGIGWAALGATAAGMLIYKYYFDDGPGGIAKETLAGAGKKTSKYRAELDELFEKAFVEKAGFFGSMFGDEDDYSMVKKTRGENDEQLLRRLKASDKLSDEEKERAEELMALIAEVQIATRIQQVGKKLKEFPDMDPDQVYGQVVGGEAAGKKYPQGWKPGPIPGGGGSGKAAKQRKLAQGLGMSIKDIQKKLMNYFKKGSNTFSVKENKGAGLEPDGKYGGETEQAIKDFQNEFNGYVDAGKIKAKKLTPDGLFGPATLAAVKMVEQNKELYALSKLNPSYSNKGTMVAGRGAAGLPGGGKSDKKDAVTIGPVGVSLENPTNSVFGGNVYVATVKTSDGKEFKGEQAQSGTDDKGDIEVAKAQAIDKAKAHIKSLTKESKRGKTTMNKTRLINIIKEEIENLLSENRFDTSGLTGASNDPNNPPAVSVKGKKGVDLRQKMEKDPRYADLKQSRFDLLGLHADPRVSKEVEEKREKQKRLTNPATLRKIQQKLIQLQFLPAKIEGSRQDDGSYGLNTMQAIQKFQKWANKSMPGLEPGDVDGLAGPKTRRALFKAKLENVLVSKNMPKS